LAVHIAKPATVPDIRLLTADERQLLEWLLSHGTSEAATYLEQLPRVSVFARCGCGCPSIDLAVGERAAQLFSPSTILADAAGKSPEGVGVGIIVHGREGLISELEVYSLAGEDVRFTLPRIEDIDRYDAD
jgi:hypothetical protein